VRVLFCDNSCSGVRAPKVEIRSVWIVVQLPCCGDADYCPRPASSFHANGGIRRHGESDEEATALGTEGVEVNEASVKDTDFVS